MNVLVTLIVASKIFSKITLRWESVMKSINRVMMLFIASVFMQTAIAANGHIDVVSSAKKQVVQVNADGQREITYIEPTTVLPGDVIMYTTTFENTSDEVAADIVINNRVPNNSWYRDGSAKGNNTELQFSVDGNVFDKAENLYVTVDGEKRQATAKDYVTLRWVYTAELKPGEKRSVSFKTQIKKPNE